MNHNLINEVFLVIHNVDPSLIQNVEACKQVKEGSYPVQTTLAPTPAPAVVLGSWRPQQATPSQYVFTHFTHFQQLPTTVIFNVTHMMNLASANNRKSLQKLPPR